VGGTGSPSSRAHKLSATEELDQDRRASDAACIRGSYRSLHHGSKPPCAFERCESSFCRDLHASSSRDLPPRRSTYSEASSSTGPPPRRLTYNEASSSSDSPPVPRFDPGDYAEDENIPLLAAKLEHTAPALMAGGFVPDFIMGTITKLVEEHSLRDTDKKAEWLSEQAAQDVDCCVSRVFSPQG
jgi:hypothetical protein